MIYTNNRIKRKCPLCGSMRIGHKIGSKKWFCRECRTFFYVTPTGIVYKKSQNQKHAKTLDHYGDA